MRRAAAFFLTCALSAGLLTGCGGEASSAPAGGTLDLTPTGSMPLSYAEQFTVDTLENGLSLITIGGEDRYLVVPEGQQAPQTDADITVLQQPIDSIYLVATSAMDFFISLDALDTISLSGTKADGWYLDEARQAMKNGDIEYAGKYSAPDYEAIFDADCDLAVESTMIYHTPEVKEQLERLGIPVLVERSSYESHPLGRMEWIKLYGVLTGKEDEAEALYQEQLDTLSPILDQPSTGKTAAFFYITANGAVNVRKSTDYVPKMLELAGGKYIFDDLTDDDARSTMNMQMENFYAGAKDADVLIYNSTIDGELHSLDELLAKSPLLADFKAVKNGNVWCTEQSLFQSAMGLGGMIQDFHAIFSGENTDNLHYLHQLT